MLVALAGCVLNFIPPDDLSEGGFLVPKNKCEQAYDEEWMRQALVLAEKGQGKTYPNPMVGAVLVKHGAAIGEGYHALYGGPHAEVAALANCSEDPSGATLYVTLEPCCHYGKTPPCTEAIIRAGIGRVVVGAVDPNPLVSGQGIAALKAAGIAVTTGVLAQKAQELNRAFNHYMNYQRPYVLLKAAMSLDGKIATRSGDSKWITGETARKEAHKTRGQVKAIMAGIGTVLADDPLLTCRVPDENGIAEQPIRIVLDKKLLIPMASNLVQSALEIPLMVITTETQHKSEKAARLEALGVSVRAVSLKAGHFNWHELLQSLSLEGIDSLLLEGGGILHDSALRAGVVDEVHFYIAPLLIGGIGAKGAIGGLGVERLTEAVALESVSLLPCGKDWLYKAKVIHAAAKEADHSCLQE